MRIAGRLPLLETVEKGTRLVIDAKCQWIRAFRDCDKDFLGIAKEKIEVGQSAIFCFMDDAVKENNYFSASYCSQYGMFLSNFTEYLESLGDPI